MRNPVRMRSGPQTDGSPLRTACGSVAWKPPARAALRTFAGLSENPARRLRSIPAGAPAKLKTFGGRWRHPCAAWVAACAGHPAEVRRKRFPAPSRSWPAGPRAATAPANRDKAMHEPEAHAARFRSHTNPRSAGPHAPVTGLRLCAGSTPLLRPFDFAFPAPCPEPMLAGVRRLPASEAENEKARQSLPGSFQTHQSPVTDEWTGTLSSFQLTLSESPLGYSDPPVSASAPVAGRRGAQSAPSAAHARALRPACARK